MIGVLLRDRKEDRERHREDTEKTWQRLESGLNKPKNGKDLDR